MAYTSIPNRAPEYVVPAEEYNLINRNADDHEERIVLLENEIVPPPTIYRVKATRNGDQSVNHDTLTNFLWNAEVYDIGNMHSTSVNSDRLVAPVAGDYRADLFAVWNLAPSGFRAISITAVLAAEGGTPRIFVVDNKPGSNDFSIAHSVGATLRMAAGDYVTSQGYQNSGGTINLDFQNFLAPSFSLTILQEL